MCMAIANGKAVYDWRLEMWPHFDAPGWLGSHEDPGPLLSKLHPDLHVVTWLSPRHLTRIHVFVLPTSPVHAVDVAQSPRSRLARRHEHERVTDCA